MHAAAADRQHLAALGHVVLHAAGFIQLVALLVEVGHLEARAQLHRAALRGQLAQDEAEQGGLARAVRAQDAHLVAARDHRAEAAQDHLLAPGEVHAAGAQDQAARALGILQAQLRAAGSLAAGLAFSPQALQRPHAPLVARAPGADALAQPDLLGRQLAVELGVLRQLDRGERLAALEIGGVVAGPAAQAPAIQLQDAPGQSAQEGAVVGDEEERAREAPQLAFEPGDGVDVQVVGGLVEEEQVRRHHQGAGEQGPPLAAGGERGQVGVTVQTGPREGLLHQVGLFGSGRRQAGRGEARGHRLAHAAGERLRQLLGQEGHAQARGAGDLAGVGGQRALEEAKQGGLAGAVAPQQADALAALDLQLDAVKEERPAQGEGDVLEVDEGHGGRR